MSEKITQEVQQHPSRRGDTMAANVQNMLSYHANKLSFAIPPLSAAVSRAVRELAVTAGAHATLIKKQMALRLQMIRSFFTYTNLALAGFWALHDVPARAPRVMSRAIEPMRMTIEDHWQRATGVIRAAVAGFERVKALQAAAGRQIDAADYALTQLMHDLRTVMPLPADISGLRAVLAEAERSAPARRESKALAA
jgi:hypothetical protein